jgi:hypothetical protein
MGTYQAAGAVDSIFTLKNMLFYGLFIIIFIIVFLSAIYQSIDEHSFMPFVNKLGDSFLLTSKNLNEASLDVINGNVSFNTGSGILEFLSIFSRISLAFYMMYIWIKFLMWICAHSFLSNNSNSFINFSLSMFFFICIEIIALLIFGAINNEIHTLSDATDLLMLPFTCFKNLFFAVKQIVMPASQIIDKVNIQNLTK